MERGRVMTEPGDELAGEQEEGRRDKLLPKGPDLSSMGVKYLFFHELASHPCPPTPRIGRGTDWQTRQTILGEKRKFAPPAPRMAHEPGSTALALPGAHPLPAESLPWEKCCDSNWDSD